MKKCQPYFQACAASARMFFCEDCKYYCPSKKDKNEGICARNFVKYPAIYHIYSSKYVSGYDENCGDFEPGTYSGKNIYDR